MRYAPFAKICEKCGKVPNMPQLHIRIFLTCLSNTTNNNNSNITIIKHDHKIMPSKKIICTVLKMYPASEWTFTNGNHIDNMNTTKNKLKTGSSEMNALTIRSKKVQCLQRLNSN